MTNNLWPHQERAVQHIINNRASLIAYEMGAGKTRCAIEAMKALDVKRVLILCPKSVVGVWPEELKKWGSEGRFDFAPTKGTTKRKAKDLNGVLHHVGLMNMTSGENNQGIVVAVFNYEAAWRGDLGKLLHSVQWDMVICDEIHRIKSHSGKQSKWCAKLQATRKVGLTGTPMPHSPLDAFGLFRFLDPSIFGPYWTPFRARYAILKQIPGVQAPIVDGFQRIDELETKIAPLTLRVKTADVIAMPDATDQTITYQMESKQAKAYKQIEDDLLADIDEGTVTVGNALTKLLRLCQIASGFVAVDQDDPDAPPEIIDLAPGKRAIVKDILEDLPDKPVVVFCRFRWELEGVRAVCAKLKRTCMELSGQRREFDEWRAADGNEVLAVQIQAGGLGISMVRSHHAVYMSTGLSLGDYLQSRARQHRPGQTERVHYIHIAAAGTVDQSIMRALSKREDLVDGILTRMRQKVGA